MDAVKTELILADLETCDKRRKRRGNSLAESKVWDRLFDHLNQGNAARDMVMTKDEDEIVKQISLLSHKPIVYV